MATERMVYGVDASGNLMVTPARKGKYRNTFTQGLDAAGNPITFDSAAEAARNAELLLLERMGKITNLQRQVRFNLIPSQPGERPAYYVADFVYVDAAGKQVVEDVKGKPTRDYILKRKLMLYLRKIRVVEISAAKPKRRNDRSV